MNLPIKRASLVLVFSMVACSTAFAQRVLDWPLRTSAGPEAVTRGPEAAFWNPAGISPGTSRGEIIIADQRTPDIVGIGGFAAAASWRLDARTTLAAGYQHVSIDEIGETSTSPLPDGGAPTFSISEDQVAAGASHMLGPAVVAGANVRYDRSDETGFTESTTSLGAGFLVMPPAPLSPVIAASLLTQSDGVRYTTGIQIATEVARELEARAGYGVRGGEHLTLEHRAGVTFDWRSSIAATAGVATAAVGSERSWEVVLGASLRVSRYELGVLRETLANDFGSAYSFRLRVGLK